MEATWTYDNRLIVDPPKKPKKITGTRFAAILGQNPWKTEFATWCEITRTYEEPFEDTIYTKAGKIIEPKQAEFIRKHYHIDVVAPAQVYGSDYFKTTRGDFFSEYAITGGMWDYLERTDGVTTGVFEMKTTKRAEDWSTDIPEYYALQAALYAWMLGVENVYMVCSFLSEDDYTNPEAFVPSFSNTIVKPFKVSERYPNFETLYKTATEWWKKHVVSGVSPMFDEEKDADTLRALHTRYVSPEVDITELFDRAETLKAEIDEVNAKISAKEDELKAINANIKEFLVKQMTDDDTKVVVAHGKTEWTLSKSTRIDLDRTAMIADGIFDKYNTVSSISYKLTSKTKE